MLREIGRHGTVWKWLSNKFTFHWETHCLQHKPLPGYLLGGCFAIIQSPRFIPPDEVGIQAQDLPKLWGLCNPWKEAWRKTDSHTALGDHCETPTPPSPVSGEFRVSVGSEHTVMPLQVLIGTARDDKTHQETTPSQTWRWLFVHKDAWSTASVFLLESGEAHCAPRQDLKGCSSQVFVLAKSTKYP